MDERIFLDKLNTLEDVMSFYTRTANNIVRNKDIDEATKERLKSFKNDIIKYINELTIEMVGE